MIAVVVGAGPGMGQALARRFGSEGFTVALIARRAEALDSYVTELSADGIAATGFVADIAIESSLRGAFAQIRAQLGDPDVLLFNASSNPPGRPEDISADDCVEAYKIGVLGALICAQEVCPAMRGKGAGSVFFTGGGLALKPWPQSTALGMAKAALRNLVAGLATDLAGTGIHVGSVVINGLVGKPGFEPHVIADRFWDLHIEPVDEFTHELIHP
jgi:short-subunit dehydrogenase